MQAAVSVGAVVRAGLDEQRPLVFTLPNHENSFATSSLHPIRRACIDDIVVDEKRILEGIDSRHGEEGLESNHSQHLSKRPREPLFVVDPRATKYLKTSAPESTPEPTKEPAQEPEALPKESAEQIEEQEEPAKIDHVDCVAAAQNPGTTPRRPAEKKVFLETLEKSGRDWELLSQAVGTKTTAQIKNFYYDHKKQLEKKKETRKPARAEKIRRKDGRSATPVLTGQTSDLSESYDFANREDGQGSVVLSPIPPAPPQAPADSSFDDQKANAASKSPAKEKPRHEFRSVDDHHCDSTQTNALVRHEGWDQTQTQSGQSSLNQLQHAQASGPQQHCHDTGEVSRLLQHHPQSHHQQIVSGFLPWMVSSSLGHGDHRNGSSIAELEQQQLQVLLMLQHQHQQHQSQHQQPHHQQQHQQQHQQRQDHQHQQPHHHFQSLNLASLVNPAAALELLELERQQQLQRQQQQEQQQQHVQRQEQQSHMVDDRLAALQHLLSSGGGRGENASSALSTLSALALLARAIQQQQGPGHNSPGSSNHNMHSGS
ncbi:hypothetical protein ACA910_021652 [Epithemia clementina (nom. ined.)]